MEAGCEWGRLSWVSRNTVARGFGLLFSLLLLNSSLTFTNIWPTFGIRFTNALSVETAVCVLGLALLHRRGGLSRGVLRLLTVFWIVLFVGRYAEVTATSLYGRDINLYWDLRHLPNVGTMFAFVADPWITVTVIAFTALAPILFYGVVRLAIGSIADVMSHPLMRRVLCLTSTVVLFLSIVQLLGLQIPDGIRFAKPVLPTYARELGEFAYEMSGAGLRDLGPPTEMRSDLSRIDGADVFLVFLESYGAVSWDRPEFNRAMSPTRARLKADISETGRDVASAFVESTTFGGQSWLAHISLLTGVEVRDQGTNVRLMAQERDTLVKVFGRQGYRLVCVFGVSQCR